MVQIEYLPIVLTGIGIIVSILYYTSVLRNANTTRKTQLYTQLFLTVSSEEFMKRSIDILAWEFEDYDDLVKKYFNNPSLTAKWFSQTWWLDGLGYLISEGLLDPEMVYNFGGGGNAQINHWLKWESIIAEMRIRREDPEFLKWFEYVFEKMKELRTKKGLKPIPSS